MAEFNMSFPDDEFEIKVLDNFTLIEPVNHNDLRNRDKSDAHPMGAITGLAELSELVNRMSSALSELSEQVNEIDNIVDIATLSEIEDYISGTEE